MKIKFPKIIKGQMIVDDRGMLSFANSFKFNKVKRFYLVQNHENNFIRAWHAHKKEEKYVVCLQGAAMVCAVKINNFSKPDTKSKIHKFFLHDKDLKILYIPNGYANGFKNLDKNTKLMFFSNQDLKSSINDDYRYKYDFWNPWDKKFR